MLSVFLKNFFTKFKGKKIFYQIISTMLYINLLRRYNFNICPLATWKRRLRLFDKFCKVRRKLLRSAGALF